ARILMEYVPGRPNPRLAMVDVPPLDGDVKTLSRYAPSARTTDARAERGRCVAASLIVTRTAGTATDVQPVESNRLHALATSTAPVRPAPTIRTRDTMHLIPSI